MIKQSRFVDGGTDIVPSTDPRYATICDAAAKQKQLRARGRQALREARERKIMSRFSGDGSEFLLPDDPNYEELLDEVAETQERIRRLGEEALKAARKRKARVAPQSRFIGDVSEIARPMRAQQRSRFVGDGLDIVLSTDPDYAKMRSATAEVQKELRERGEQLLREARERKARAPQSRFVGDAKDIVRPGDPDYDETIEAIIAKQKELRKLGPQALKEARRRFSGRAKQAAPVVPAAALAHASAFPRLMVATFGLLLAHVLVKHFRGDPLTRRAFLGLSVRWRDAR